MGGIYCGKVIFVDLIFCKSLVYNEVQFKIYPQKDFQLRTFLALALMVVLVEVARECSS